MLLATDASRIFLHWWCTQLEVVEWKITEDGLTEHPLGNPFEKELAQADSRHPWLTIPLFKIWVFCFFSGRQSHLYADLFKVQLTYSISNNERMVFKTNKKSEMFLWKKKVNHTNHAILEYFCVKHNFL